MDIIGHEDIRNRFIKRVMKNTLSHAHLIIGEDGIGKSLIAQEFATKVLDVPLDKEHVDIVKFRSNKTSFGVDVVRDIIAEVNKKPYEGSKKVIILYEGEKMTPQAQNAILKTIEEPPKGVFIIILSQNGEFILDTMKSRCQIHKLSPLNKEEMLKFINAKYNINDTELVSTLIAFSEGVPGRVEKFLKDEDFNTVRNIIIELLNQINSREPSLTLKYADKFIDINIKEDEILSTIITFIRDIIVYKEIKRRSSLINGDKFEDIKNISNSISYKKLKGIINTVDKARINLNSNTNSWIVFNTMLINILEE